MKVLVQLHDGREFNFDAEAPDIIASLKASGVKVGDIKNTIHVIPRSVAFPARPHARD